MCLHDSQKVLELDFDTVWERLRASGRQSVKAPDSHNFSGFATRGVHNGKKVIRCIKNDRTELARIYPCCWGHTTNCSGARIGDYSDALDRWAGQRPMRT